MPECYFDTVLIKKLVKNNELIWHQKGCNNVVKKCLSLKNTFNVGIIDKDKKDLKGLAEFKSYSVAGLSIYFKDSFGEAKKSVYENNVIFIQLNPPIEKWIVNICDEMKIDLNKFSLPTEVGELRYITKSQLADETKQLIELCDELIKSKNEIIDRLNRWVNYILNNFDKKIDYNFFQNV